MYVHSNVQFNISVVLCCIALEFWFVVSVLCNVCAHISTLRSKINAISTEK